ncbi:MAG: sigma-70 family RNA polymerase sigma factor [Myxococcota bacterium]
MTTVPAPPRRPRRDLDLEAQVSAALRGEPRARRDLFDGVLPIFVKAGSRLLGPRHPDLDDFVQEAAIRFFRGLPGYRGDSRLVWFAQRIATYTATDWIRSERSLKRSQVRGPIPEGARSDDDPRRDFARLELSRLLRRALPEAQLETFVMRAIFGVSIAEIAEQTGVPINTVRSRLSLAKRRLKRHINEEPAWRDLLREHFR